MPAELFGEKIKYEIEDSLDNDYRIGPDDYYYIRRLLLFLRYDSIIRVIINTI
jgi:hypothetical protein